MPSCSPFQDYSPPLLASLNSVFTLTHHFTTSLVGHFRREAHLYTCEKILVPFYSTNHLEVAKKKKEIHPKRKRKTNKKKSHSFKILILQMLPILTDPSTIPLPCCLSLTISERPHLEGISQRGNVAFFSSVSCIMLLTHLQSLQSRYNSMAGKVGNENLREKHSKILVFWKNCSCNERLG